MDALTAWGLTPVFSLWTTPVTWVELLAFGLSLWMVRCNMQVHPLAWPLAMLSSGLYGLLFWESRLYGEAGLQVVFITVALWGWHQWVRDIGPQRHGRAVSHLDPRQAGICCLSLLLLWPVLGWVLDQTTDSDVPYLDALPTVGSLIGQWLLGRKYIENWLVWVFVNFVSVALFAVKGLWLTTLLYLLFFILSWVGWLSWLKLSRAPRASTGSPRQSAV